MWLVQMELKHSDGWRWHTIGRVSTKDKARKLADKYHGGIVPRSVPIRIILEGDIPF